MDIEEARRRLAAHPPQGDPTAVPGETLGEKADRLRAEQPVQGHLCVGPTCWTCGTPAEIRDLRSDLIRVFYELQQAKPGADHHAHARAAAEELRPTLMRWLHAENFVIGVEHLAREAARKGEPLDVAAVQREIDAFRQLTAHPTT